MAKLKQCVPYIVALAVCAFVSFPIFSNSVVLDEAYTVILVRKGVGDIIRGASGDVHPPLYYLILKLTSLFGGESLLLYRFVTALGSYLNLLFLGATLIRRQWGSRVSVIYILWFGLTYCTLDLSYLLRMYTWAAFFVTAAALYLYFYYIRQLKRDLVLGSLMTLGAMYTHYYALIAVFLIWLLLLLFSVFTRKKFNWVLIGGVLVTIGYLPWLRVLLSQSRRVADGYWINNFDWNEWRQVPAALMDPLESTPNGSGMVLYALILATVFVAILRKKWTALLCAAVFLGVMLAGAGISIAITPIWATRYLYVAWGLIALFMAITLGEVISINSDMVQVILVLVLLIAGAYSYKTMMETENIIYPGDEWVAFLQAYVEDNSYVIFDDPQEHGIVYEFYLPDARLICAEVLQSDEGEKNFEAFLTESEDHQLWYIVNYRLPNLGPDRMEEYLGQQGYTMETAGSFMIRQKTLEVFRVENER